MDRLTFQHWRLVVPDGHTLAALFSLRLKFQRVPENWTSSKTVFIPKKDECGSLADWRPISLCNTIAKFFTGCISKRLIDWASSEQVLCPAQKRFMPFDGPFENNYSFSQKIHQARKSLVKELCAASIDLPTLSAASPINNCCSCQIWRWYKV